MASGTFSPNKRSPVSAKLSRFLFDIKISLVKRERDRERILLPKRLLNGRKSTVLKIGKHLTPQMLPQVEDLAKILVRSW